VCVRVDVGGRGRGVMVRRIVFVASESVRYIFDIFASRHGSVVEKTSCLLLIGAHRSDSDVPRVGRVTRCFGRSV